MAAIPNAIQNQMTQLEQELVQLTDAEVATFLPAPPGWNRHGIYEEEHTDTPQHERYQKIL